MWSTPLYANNLFCKLQILLRPAAQQARRDDGTGTIFLSDNWNDWQLNCILPICCRCLQDWRSLTLFCSWRIEQLTVDFVIIHLNQELWIISPADTGRASLSCSQNFLLCNWHLSLISTVWRRGGERKLLMMDIFSFLLSISSTWLHLINYILYLQDFSRVCLKILTGNYVLSPNNEINLHQYTTPQNGA